MFCEFWDFVDHALVNGLREGRIADVKVKLQSDLAKKCFILLKDKVPFKDLIAKGDAPTFIDQQQLKKISI